MDDARIHQAHRRAFLGRACALGAASLAGFPPFAFAEPLPEVTRVPLVRVPALCGESCYEMAREILKSLYFDRWCTDNPADALRFHALRPREAGIIKSTPQQLLDRASDFPFLKELKKELKA